MVSKYKQTTTVTKPKAQYLHICKSGHTSAMCFTESISSRRQRLQKPCSILGINTGLAMSFKAWTMHTMQTQVTHRIS